MIMLSLFLILLCCLIIWRACDGYEAASEYLGRNMSEGVRGATINAIGSSVPELFTTLFFLFVLFDKDGFAGGIGTTAGSAVFNGMIIPALVIFVVVLGGVVKGVKISRKVLLRDGIALLLCELVLILLIGGDKLTWVHGLILMGLYGAYVTYMLTSMKAAPANQNEDEDEDEDEGSEGSTLTNLLTLNLEPIFVKGSINGSSAWALLISALVVIAAACFLLVKSCEWLGESLHLPIYFIAVILASAATSVPDTILSMKDAKAGNYDDAVANALGSNIFDVCFALGLPLFLFTLFYGSIQMTPETVANVAELRILLFILTFLAFLIYIIPSKLGVKSAVLLLAIYVIFTAYIIGRAYGWEWAGDIGQTLLNIDSRLDVLRPWT